MRGPEGSLAKKADLSPPMKEHCSLRSANFGRSRPKMHFFRTFLAMPKANATPAPAQAEQALPTSYEEAVQELEQLLAKLESGQLPLDQLLTHYQRGATLLAYCRERLAAIENQISVLDEGALKPWDGQ